MFLVYRIMTKIYEEIFTAVVLLNENPFYWCCTKGLCKWYTKIYIGLCKIIDFYFFLLRTAFRFIVQFWILQTNSPRISQGLSTLTRILRPTKLRRSFWLEQFCVEQIENCRYQKRKRNFLNYKILKISYVYIYKYNIFYPYV